MNSQEVYRLLTAKLPHFTEYQDIPVKECDEPLVPITESNHLAVSPIDKASSALLVRKTVFLKLQTVSKALASIHPELKLEVVYGHRSMQIQMALFEEQKRRLSRTFSGEELIAETHKFIAIPEAAGHPTGGAVDVQITPLDFGSPIWEFTDACMTFSPFIEKQAWKNRQLLRGLMVEAGFAPYDGEWWHFSYGDKEWAHYYNKSQAIYGALNEL